MWEDGCGAGGCQGRAQDRWGSAGLGGRGDPSQHHSVPLPRSHHVPGAGSAPSLPWELPWGWVGGWLGGRTPRAGFPALPSAGKKPVENGSSHPSWLDAPPELFLWVCTGGGSFAPLSSRRSTKVEIKRSIWTFIWYFFTCRIPSEGKRSSAPGHGGFQRGVPRPPLLGVSQQSGGTGGGTVPALSRGQPLVAALWEQSLDSQTTTANPPELPPP